MTQIFGIGIGVGVGTWSRHGGDLVRREVIEKAVKRVMEGEEAEEMRNKAKGLAKMARRAIKEGGSSYLDLDALIDALSLVQDARDLGSGEFVTKMLAFYVMDSYVSFLCYGFISLSFVKCVPFLIYFVFDLIIVIFQFMILKMLPHRSRDLVTC